MRESQEQMSTYPKATYQKREGYAIPIRAGEWCFLDAETDEPKRVRKEQLTFTGGTVTVSWDLPL